MLNKSDLLRESLNLYIQNKGVKQVWISKQIGLDATALCRYLKNKLILNSTTLKQIEQFLINQGALK